MQMLRFGDQDGNYTDDFNCLYIEYTKEIAGGKRLEIGGVD